MKIRFLAAISVLTVFAATAVSVQADPAVQKQETTVFIMGTSTAARSAFAERKPNGINISLQTSG